jgi:hypothetical protein
MQRRPGFEQRSSLIQEVTSSGRCSHRKDNLVCLVFLLLADGSRQVADNVSDFGTRDDVRPAGNSDPSVSCQDLQLLLV